ncbi:MAG: DUF4179 domain-containing protein [Clostridium sp.]|uniref:DUF4179 domain-containing protein n=1 Tax=Clostridium sp. TaxID=1506 RepID=UPI003F378055
MHKNMDDEIKDLLNKEEVVPMSVKNKKEEAFNIIRVMERKDMKKKSLFNKKSVAIAAAVVIGSITLSSPILAEVKELIFNGRYKGVQTAISNGYEQNIEGVYSESNGIRLEVINAVADPTMIKLKFKLSSEDIKKIKEFEYVEKEASINTFNIKDDKERVLQFYDKNEGRGGKPVIDEKGKEVWLISGGDEAVDVTDIDNGNIFFEIMLASSEGNLKEIKELNLQTNEIANLTGNWNLNIKLDEAMVNSEVVNYVVDKENDIVEVIEAKGMATGLKVKFRINIPVDETIISQVKLVDKKGTEYRSERIANMGIVDGKDIVEMTFEASKFENLDKFDLVVEDLNGKDEVVKLIKKEK